MIDPYMIFIFLGGRPVYVSNGSHILSYSKDEARVTVVYGKVCIINFELFSVMFIHVVLFIFHKDKVLI